VKNIDTSIFKYEHQFLAFRRVDFNWSGGSFSIDLWHL